MPRFTCGRTRLKKRAARTWTRFGQPLSKGEADYGFDAPEGHIKVDPKNLHVYKAFYMGKIRGDKQFDIIYKTGPD